MKKMLLISLLVIALSSMFIILNAYDTGNTDTNCNFSMYPNPMETVGTVCAYFTERMPISISLLDNNDEIVKTIYSGSSIRGQMLIPFDRIDSKGNTLPNGKYWVSLSTNAKYTSTKKLLILK